jgi:hypothetical protein
MMWFLALTLILSPIAASAAPITAFFVNIGVGAAFAAVLTQTVITIALNVAVSLLFKPKVAGGTPPQNVQINTRLDTAARWQLGGRVAVGGSAGVFAEKDASGNLWYIIAHGDAEVTGTPTYILDGIPVALSNGADGFTAGDVITNDFCLNTTGANFNGTGTKMPVFRLYTVTPTSIAVSGVKPAAFTTAFPTLPADFNLAGVCYTIVRCMALDAASYRNAMRWRGVLGLGEPSVVIVGKFNRMYDPRNGAHNINDSTTWTAGDGNTAIVWAWWRTTRYGRNRPMAEINWDKVTEQANLCDLTVLNRAGEVTPLYRTGVAFPDDAARQDCEAQILKSADAFVAYDDAGLAYPVVGYYTAPTLTFSAARDIVSAQTEIIDDGEMAVDGVVIYYTDPGLGYTRQPCAIWLNTDYYDGTSAPNIYTEDILTCQDHNQAVRLAKAIGKRVAPTRKASFATTIKGILAKGQRSITLDYDATFQGVYEIASPVEEDPSGIGAGFAVVPLDVDRWYLNGGEEGAPPSATPALSITVPNTLYPVPSDLIASSALGAAGSYTAAFTTANDVNQFAVSLYRGTTVTFSAATIVHTVFAGPNFDGFDTETGVSAGTYYIWVQPLNQTYREGTAAGPYTVTVT